MIQLVLIVLKLQLNLRPTTNQDEKTETKQLEVLDARILHVKFLFASLFQEFVRFTLKVPRWVAYETFSTNSIRLPGGPAASRRAAGSWHQPELLAYQEERGPRLEPIIRRETLARLRNS